MTASLRAVIALAAIAVALAIVVALGGGRAAPVNHALLPDLGDLGSAHELRWTFRSGTPIIAKRLGASWSVSGRRADARTIDGVLAALRGARWHRDADASRAGDFRALLYIDDQPPIAICQPLAGVDQTWMVVDNRAKLVDGWVARALDPGDFALIDRTPLARASGAAKLRVDGQNFQLALDVKAHRTSRSLVVPKLVDALTTALADMQYVAMAPADAERTPAALTIRLDDADAVTIGGSCGSAGSAAAAGSANVASWDPGPAARAPVLVRARDTEGCVAPADISAIVELAFTLTTDAAIDRRPFGEPIAAIALPDGALDLAKQPRVAVGSDAPVDADASRTAELIAALAQDASDGLAAIPATPPRATLVITPRTGEPVTLDVYATAVARRGEPRALAVAPETIATLLRPARAYRDPSRWAEDATTVAKLELDGVSYARGAVLGEWTRTLRTGAAAMPEADGALVDALAAAAASVRAPDAPLPPAFRPAHHLVVTLAPPIGRPITHALDLAAPSPDGCAARLDGTATVTAPLALCTAVAALAH